ncbi:unnamed protein product [Schistosoma rodhaini]|uniref:Carboxylesterase type B domain-containing protein n=1 Tax=Schistosoma rodhaini TaxID=6188 RepID=A0AA85FK55_9TREM|nr:unnamed protein product [Schistosoma rodhaini]
MSMLFVLLILIQNWVIKFTLNTNSNNSKMINNEKNNDNQKITLKKQETMHNGINIDNVDDNIITLIDGKRLTGIKLHLPLSSLNPVIAYYGIRYASLGVQHIDIRDQLSRMATTTNHSDSFKFNNNHDIMKMPALHRFSHSVASFFYESPIGVYSHSILPPVCPQPSIHVHLEDKDIPKQVKDRLIRLLPFLRNQDEDCLTLNIYVPQQDKTRKSYKRPIFLFVHGESYEYGSGNAYDLSVLASYSDTIGITLNYRLGLLGFLFTNNHGISGNYALYDLHAAIMWIKTNIESFNGNSNEITLIGYGHGAALVHLFSLSKMSQGTTGSGIKRIILLNGSGFAPWSTSHKTSSILIELLKQLNITNQNLRNNKSLNENNPYQHHNIEYSNRQKSLFSQTDNMNSLKPFNDSLHNLGPFTTNINLPLQLLKHLFLTLKNSTIEFLINLQEKLTQSFLITRLGPVISRNLFPNYLIDSNSIKKIQYDQGYHKPPPPQQQQQQSQQWYSQFIGKSNELNNRILETLSIETSLFMNTDLLIGWTEAPASNLYYSHSNIHKMPYSLLIEKLVYEIYPYNQDVIKEIIEYAYCNSDIFHFNNNNNNDDYIGNSEKQFKEVDCRWKILDILSDGLYTVPIIQTLKMHSDFYTSQRMINRMQNPSLSSSLPTLLFPTGTPTITRLKEQINNYDKHRKSTYALFFNYKTSQQITKQRNATRKQLQMGKIGFADDLPYLLGAPFISPNQLEPFSNEYTDMDKKISVNLMNYLANFMHNGDPNKEFMGHQTKKIPVHWPEYTYDSRLYLHVGDESRSKQSFHQTKSHIRNLWGNKENEHFTMKQLYESDKHKLWSTLFPRLTLMDRKTKGFSMHNGNEDNIEKYPYQQTLFSKYFYFLQLKEKDWLTGQVNKMKTNSRLFQNYNQNVENLLNLVENSRLYETTHSAISNVSYSGNFSQLPLYKENDIDQNSNIIIEVPFENNKLLMHSNLSNKSQSIDDETNIEIQSYSQSLTKSGHLSYSYSTLIWIIFTGSILFLLNTLIFIAIYYQTHQLRKNTIYQQSKSNMKTSSINKGTKQMLRIKQKRVSNINSLNKNESWQINEKDGKIITYPDVSNSLYGVNVSSSTATSSAADCYALNDLSYSLHQPQHVGFNTCSNKITPALHEIPTVTTNLYNTTDNKGSISKSYDKCFVNLWNMDSPTVIGQTTNSLETKYLIQYPH